MYVRIWQFDVLSGKEKMFERYYGSKGDWATLFHRWPGFIRTELLRAQSPAGRYLTLDYWTSSDDYWRFREEAGAQFEQLDQLCESFTAEEIELGDFVSLP